jgi:hypothetical protein
LMEKDPDKRFADAYVVNRRLQELLRKIELSSTDVTLDNVSTGADTPTVDIASGQRAGSARGMSAGPGPGTLMHDLFRAEIEAQQRPSPLRALLENTWILVGALVVLVAGVAYWSYARTLSPEQRFDKGVALLKEDEEGNWRMVRDEYFAPLVALQSPDWDEKLQPYLDRIRSDEIKAGLKSKSRRRGGKKSESNTEVERVLTWARHQQEVGDTAGAERTLSDLAAILAENPQFEAERNVVQDSLDEFHRRTTEKPADLEFVSAALDRAEGLAKEGKTDEARRICQGIVNLYANDPQAAPFVERANRQLAAKPASAPTSPAHPSTRKSTP